MPVHRPTIKNPYYSINGGRAMAQRGGYADAKYNLQQQIHQSGGRAGSEATRRSVVSPSDAFDPSSVRTSRRPNQSRLGKIMKFLG